MVISRYWYFLQSVNCVTGQILKNVKSGCGGQPFSFDRRTKARGRPELHKGGQNAITNKRLYLVSWSAGIRTSRRRGWCSYIELLSTFHFDLPGLHAPYECPWFLLYSCAHTYNQHSIDNHMSACAYAFKSAFYPCQIIYIEINRYFNVISGYDSLCFPTYSYTHTAVDII